MHSFDPRAAMDVEVVVVLGIERSPRPVPIPRALVVPRQQLVERLLPRGRVERLRSRSERRPGRRRRRRTDRSSPSRSPLARGPVKRLWRPACVSPRETLERVLGLGALVHEIADAQLHLGRLEPERLTVVTYGAESVLGRVEGAAPLGAERVEASILLTMADCVATAIGAAH